MYKLKSKIIVIKSDFFIYEKQTFNFISKYNYIMKILNLFTSKFSKIALVP